MVERMNSTMIYLIYCKNFCKWCNVPPPSTIKIHKLIKKKPEKTPKFQTYIVHSFVSAHIRSRAGPSWGVPKH
jgi:hypothetical protein